MFNNGHRVSGTLTGDLDGDYVKNIGNITMFINGIKLGKTFYAYGNDFDNIYTNTSMLSANAALNNFSFLDTGNWQVDAFTTRFTFDGYADNDPFHYNHVSYAVNGSTTNSAFDRPMNPSWRLEIIPPGGEAPEPATLLLAGAALAGLGAARRKAVR